MGNPDSGANAEDTDWDALARYLAGESSAEEAATMRRWLDARPERAELVAAMQRALASVDVGTADVDVEAALRSVHARMDEQAAGTPALTVDRGGSLKRLPRWEPRPIPVWQRNGLRAAAAVVLVVGAGLLWRSLEPGAGRTPAVAAQRFTSAVGERDSVKLSDGSRVLLGPGSLLTVNEGFGTVAREVELRGEAFFDVVHDQALPFTVHAGKATIVDVGTTFTVRSEDNAGVRVAVMSGAVRLRGANADTSSGELLKAGDVGLLVAAAPVVAERGTVTADDSAFTGGRLVFRDAPLTEVSAALRRWYGIELRASDSSLSHRRLTASFEGEPVERVLAVVGMTLGVDIERNGATVTVRPPRQR
jgi:transmembrane sensor